MAHHLNGDVYLVIDPGLPPPTREELDKFFPPRAKEEIEARSCRTDRVRDILSEGLPYNWEEGAGTLDELLERYEALTGIRVER